LQFDCRTSLGRRGQSRLFAFANIQAECELAGLARVVSLVTVVSFVKGQHPMPSSSNKIALFIDGANLYATAKTLGFDIDYKRLLKEFQSRGTLLRVLLHCDHRRSGIFVDPSLNRLA
jgi:hypothetical protein